MFLWDVGVVGVVMVEGGWVGRWGGGRRGEKEREKDRKKRERGRERERERERESARARARARARVCVCVCNAVSSVMESPSAAQCK